MTKEEDENEMEISQLEDEIVDLIDNLIEEYEKRMLDERGDGNDTRESNRNSKRDN